MFTVENIGIGLQVVVKVIHVVTKDVSIAESESPWRLYHKPILERCSMFIVSIV